MTRYTVLEGDVFARLAQLPDASVDLCLTSPPYWGLRSYGVEGELGAEKTLEDYLDNTLRWVKEGWRVLKPSGSLVLNLGGSYCGSGTKDQTVIPRGEPHSNLVRGVRTPTPPGRMYKTKQFLDVGAFAYQRIITETDFVCRNRAVWCKPNVPSPIRSRLKQSTESIDWFVKDPDEYYFNPKPWMRLAKARDGKEDFTGGICKLGDKETRRYVDLGSTADSPHADNIGLSPTSCYRAGKEAVYPETIEHSWRVVPVGEKQKGFELSGKEKQEHVAPFPEALIKPWVESLCPPDGTVLDPFLGSGTTLKVARDLHLNGIGIELNPTYAGYARKRLNWGEVVSGCEYV